MISGKKSVSLSKKKKDSVMVKAKKTGKAKVQAKVGRKKYIATVMVFEKKQEKQHTKAPTVTPQITPNNTQQVMPTKEAPQTTLPTQKPTRVPTATPTVTAQQRTIRQHRSGNAQNQSRHNHQKKCHTPISLSAEKRSIPYYKNSVFCRFYVPLSELVNFAATATQ